MDPLKLREKFMHEGLARDALDADPIRQFERWMADARDSGLFEPTAMSLASVDNDGQPWLRTVLLKLYDDKGFVFFTNYGSRKAGQIDANAKVALLFPWVALGRQVKITGGAAKISTAESLAYFITRPRGSRIGAWASPQSQVITRRSMLDAKFDEMKRKFAAGEIPLPDFWGGYRVVPETMEFWQGREDRLHDRFIYSRRSEEEWQIERLAP